MDGSVAVARYRLEDGVAPLSTDRRRRLAVILVAHDGDLLCGVLVRLFCCFIIELGHLCRGAQGPVVVRRTAAMTDDLYAVDTGSAFRLGEALHPVACNRLDTAYHHHSPPNSNPSSSFPSSTLS